MGIYEVPWNLEPFICDSSFDRLTYKLRVLDSGQPETSFDYPWLRAHRMKRSRILAMLSTFNLSESLKDKFIDYWECACNIKDYPDYISNELSRQSPRYSVQSPQYTSGVINQTFVNAFNNFLFIESENRYTQLFSNVNDRLLAGSRTSTAIKSHPYKRNGIEQNIEAAAYASIELIALPPRNVSASKIDESIQIMQNAQTTFLGFLDSRDDCNANTVNFIMKSYWAAADAAENLMNMKKSKITLKNCKLRTTASITIRATTTVDSVTETKAGWKEQALLSIIDIFEDLFPDGKKDIFKSGSTEGTAVRTIITNELNKDVTKDIAEDMLEGSQNCTSNNGGPETCSGPEVYGNMSFSASSKIRIAAMGEIYLEGTEITSDANIDVQVNTMIRLSSSIGKVVAQKILQYARTCTTGYERLTAILALTEGLPCNSPTAYMNPRPSPLIVNAPAPIATSFALVPSPSCPSCPSCPPTQSLPAPASLDCPLVCPPAQLKSNKKDVIVYSTITGIITAIIALLLSFFLFR